MAANRDGPDQLIAQFTPPVKGVWRTLAAHQLPLDALYDARNVCIRQGAICPRPGLLQYASGPEITGVPTGCIDYIDATGVRSLIAGTNSKLMQLNVSTTSWVDKTGAVTWAGQIDYPARFTLLEFGTPAVVYLVAVNGINTPVSWPGDATNFTAIAGTPPIFSDVITAYDRIVGTIPPYTIRWGEVLSLATWPAVNSKTLADTPDPLVGIKNLGTMSFVAYKQKSIWIAQVQGGPSSSAFAFQPRALGIDGPCSTAAVVDANGVHYYMTPNGRIGRFDGSTHKWVADGLWPLTRLNTNGVSMPRSFGVYNAKFNEIYFMYPGAADGGVCNSGVLLSLPYPEAGITDHAAFPITITGVDPSCGTPVRTALIEDKALMLAQDSLEPYTMEEGELDNEVAFSGYVQTGLVAAPDIEPAAAGVEPFTLRGAGYGTATVQVTYSDVLSAAGGAFGDSFTLDLTTTPARAIEGFVQRGRFFGLKVSFTMPTTLSWYGAHLYARSLGRGPQTNPN